MLLNKLGDYRYFHERWSPWTERDSAMVFSYKGQAGEIGHLYTWSGNEKVMQGEMEITGFGGDSIYERLSFGKGRDAKAYYVVQEQDHICRVRWGIVLPVGYFGRAVMLFVNLDKRVGKDFEEGLEKLKSVVESDTEQGHTYTVEEIEWPESTYIGRKELVGFAEMDGYFETHFGMLRMVIEKEGIKTLSAPSGLYFSYDEQKQQSELSCAFKVERNTKLKDWERFVFPAGKALQIRYLGDPAKSGNAHKAMDDYIHHNNLSYQMVIEEYRYDPRTQTDTSQWETMIYYLLK